MSKIICTSPFRIPPKLRENMHERRIPTSARIRFCNGTMCLIGPYKHYVGTGVPDGPKRLAPVASPNRNEIPTPAIADVGMLVL